MDRNILGVGYNSAVCVPSTIDGNEKPRHTNEVIYYTCLQKERERDREEMRIRKDRDNAIESPNFGDTQNQFAPKIKAKHIEYI